MSNYQGIKQGESSLESPDCEVSYKVIPILFCSGQETLQTQVKEGDTKMEFVILGIALAFLIAFGLGHLA